MTAQPPEASKPEPLKIVPAHDGTEEALANFSKRSKIATGLDLDGKKEETRSHITKWVLGTFCVLISVITIFVCGISAFGEVARLSAMSEMVQLLLAAISPVVTFILGYYFATKGE